MSHSSLASAIVNVEYLLDKDLRALATSGPDAAVMLRVSTSFRRLACGALLIDLDAGEFLDHLYRSGKTYLQLLRVHAARGLDPYHLTAGFAEPLVDAVAAGAFDLVAAIARELPARQLRDQGELPEDHHYVRSLAALASGAAPGDAPVQSALAALARAVQGDGSPRLAAAQALAAKDAERVGDAIAACQDAWRAGVERRRKAGTLDRYDADTTAHVFLEGLALLRIAGRLGAAPARTFRWVPRAAVAAVRTTFPTDFEVLLRA